MKRHLEDIPGYVVVSDGAGNMKAIAPLQVSGFKPTVTPIKDSNAFYHSYIDSSAGAKGSYLSLVSAELTAVQKAEITITEMAEAYIPNDHLPWDAIVAWAKANPESGGQKRYYVQGALLTNIARTIYVEVSTNATVDGGAAFGASGKVYATNKSSQTSNPAYIGTHLLDIDEIVKNPPTGRKGLTGVDYSNYKIKRGLVIDKLLEK
jgi:hypothetical protein